MLSRRSFLCASAAVPLLTACATDVERFRGASVSELARRRGVHAASYVFIKGGKAGRTESVSCCEPFEQAVFQAASLTKPAVAFAALQLAKRGHLDLQAPVDRYLPRGYRHRQNPFSRNAEPRFDEVGPDVLSRIRVISLLNHSAGLPNWTSGPLRISSEPGQIWSYSGEGYVMLQAVMAAASGTTFESLMESTVFAALHMHDSRMRMTQDIESRVVDGHAWPFGRTRLDMTEPNAAASLYTTAGDYARLMEAFVADDSLLERILASAISVDRDLDLYWGSGWGIAHGEGGPYLWQWGNNPGFRSFAMVSAASKDGFVVLTNSDKGMALAVPLARMVVPGGLAAFRFGMVG